MGLATSQVTALSMVAVFATFAAAQVPKGATFVGRVFSDTSMRPIAGVEVTLPALQKTATSDAKGAFRLVDIPAGTHMVRARAIGFVPFEALVEFKAGKEIERGIVLPRFTMLDSVRVVGEVNVPLSFLENRARGFGHFVTREELEKQGNRALADVVSQMPGLGVVRGRQGQGWIMSKRRPVQLKPPPRNTVGTDLYIPEDHEKLRGVIAGCYARIFLDGTLLNPSTPAEPVNLNDFGIQNIEAIEYYSGPAQTPSMYSRLNSTCGVFVIHTRRSP